MSGNSRTRVPPGSSDTREMEVFTLLGKGMITREIADYMNLSMKTIGTYRERIKDKLNLKHSNELVMHAVSA